MVNSNVDALGIIFPNSRDGVVPELVGERLMASIPFAGRYRMIDFILSSMVNSGIGNVSIIVRKNYHSLMDHLGSGREWDLTRKNGGLNIVPPFAEKTIKVYNGRLEALASILDFLRDQKEKYVVMSDADIAVNFDFSAMVDAHVKSGADVTMAYTKEKLPEAVLAERQESTEFYYTLTLDEGRVTGMEINAKDTDVTNYSMGIYVVERELLIKQITYAYTHGFVNFERDILMNQLDKLNVQAYCYEAISSIFFRTFMATSSPDTASLGRSFWEVSPVIMTFDPKPILVRNIFICAGVVFCASSRMIKALSRVRPLIYARGATSISPFSMFLAKLSAPMI